MSYVQRGSPTRNKSSACLRRCISSCHRTQLLHKVRIRIEHWYGLRRAIEKSDAGTEVVDTKHTYPSRKGLPWSAEEDQLLVKLREQEIFLDRKWSSDSVRSSLDGSKALYMSTGVQHSGNGSHLERESHGKKFHRFADKYPLFPGVGFLYTLWLSPMDCESLQVYLILSRVSRCINWDRTIQHPRDPSSCLINRM